MTHLRALCVAVNHTSKGGRTLCKRKNWIAAMNSTSRDRAPRIRRRPRTTMRGWICLLATTSVRAWQQPMPMRRPTLLRSSSTPLGDADDEGLIVTPFQSGAHQSIEASMTAPGTANERGEMLTQGLAADAIHSSRPRPKRLPADPTRPVKVQGGSLKTWTLESLVIERVQIELRTEGRPLDADVDLWHGPDNTPHKMRVYVEDAEERPFKATIETPRGPNTVAIRNTAAIEFPLTAYIHPNPPEDDDLQGSTPVGLSYEVDPPRVIQGGALKTYPFDSNVKSVQILLQTDGRPLNARIELLQGPNNVKQVIELYIEDGEQRPFFTVLETPGTGNVVRLVNTATIEFPLSAWVQPYLVAEEPKLGSIPQVIVGGTGNEFGEWDPQWR